MGIPGAEGILGAATGVLPAAEHLFTRQEERLPTGVGERALALTKSHAAADDCRHMGPGRASRTTAPIPPRDLPIPGLPAKLEARLLAAH